MAERDCTPLARAFADLAFNIAATGKVKNLDDVARVLAKDIPSINASTLADAINSAAKERATKSSSATAKVLRVIREEAGLKESLKKRIADLEQAQKEGVILTSKQRKLKKRSAFIQELRAVRDALIKQRRKSPTAQKQSLQNQIDKMKERISEEIKLPEPKRDELFKITETDKLNFELADLKRQNRTKINDLKPVGVFRRVGDVSNLFRTLKTVGEFSFVLRQGAFIGLGAPLRVARQFKPMFKALADPVFAKKIMDEIKNGPNGLKYRKSELFLSEIGGGLKKGEEEFRSALVDKIPGLKQFAGAFERSFVVFMNLLRVETFERMAGNLAKNGQPTLREMKDTASAINLFTGRGSLGKAEKFAGALNDTFFAARYAWSRVQLVVGQPLLKRGSSLAVRKEIAKVYGRFLVGSASFLSLAALGFAAASDDDEVSIEPNLLSSDAGKLKIGNTRMDVFAGMQQSIVAMARMGSFGLIKSLRTGKITDVELGTVAWRVLRGKLNPLVGSVVNLTLGRQRGQKIGEGTDVVGGKRTLRTLGLPTTLEKLIKPEGVFKEVLDLTIPITWGDILEVMLDLGMPRGTALSTLAVFGVGLQTFDTEAKKGRNVQLSEQNRKFREERKKAN